MSQSAASHAPVVLRMRLQPHRSAPRVEPFHVLNGVGAQVVRESVAVVLGSVYLGSTSGDAASVGQIGHMTGGSFAGIDRVHQQFQGAPLELRVTVGVLCKKPGGFCSFLANQRRSGPTVLSGDSL